jgi:hypothetical protein
MRASKHQPQHRRSSEHRWLPRLAAVSGLATSLLIAPLSVGAAQADDSVPPCGVCGGITDTIRTGGNFVSSITDPTLAQVNCADSVPIPSAGVPAVDPTGTTPDPTDPATTSPPLGLIGAVTAVQMTLTDCTGVDAGLSSDGTIAVGGSVVAQPVVTTAQESVSPLGLPLTCGSGDWHPGNGSYPGPGGDAINPNGSANLKLPRTAQVTYGGVYDTCDGSNIYMTGYVFKPKVTDHNGIAYTVIQSGTATAGSQTNIDRFQSFIHIEQGSDSSTFRDYSPKGDNEVGSSTPTTVSIGFSVGAATISATRSFNISNTVFGGDTPYREGTNVPFARGGYRSIAQGHRNESRYFVQMAAWNVPASINPSWTLNLDQHAYKR